MGSSDSENYVQDPQYSVSWRLGCYPSIFVVCYERCCECVHKIQAFLAVFLAMKSGVPVAVQGTSLRIFKFKDRLWSTCKVVRVSRLLPVQ